MMNVFQRGVISLSVLLITLLTCAGIAEACGAWRVMPSPNPSSSGNHLQAVTAVSPNSVYATGYSIIRTRTGNLMKQPLIEHFHNSTWSVMLSPSIGPVDSTLTGVVALSDRNIYAVGSAPGGLIEHFNGSTWSVVAHQPLCNLNAIAAISPTNIYAVGGVAGYLSKTCIVHFNGSTWSKVPSPSPGTSDDALFGVAAVSSTSVYAVGSYCIGVVCDRGAGNMRTLIEHFNGSTWSVVNSPDPSSSYNSLKSVAVVSATNIYAVGSHAPSIPQPGVSSTLIEHFNGSRWSVVSSPNVKGNSSLHAIAVVSASNIYAVGQASIPTAPANPTLIEHFNGSTWSIISSPSPGRFNVFDAVARVPKTNQVWAVGGYNTNNPDQTLTEFTC